MVDPVEYLAAAIILAVQDDTNTALPDNIQRVTSLLRDVFDITIGRDELWKAIRKLEEWSLVTVIDDEYAGEMLNLYRSRVLRYEGAPSHTVEKALSGGVQWMGRVLGNDRFWSDFQTSDQGSDMNVQGDQSVAPASDRVVSFSDNQIDDLEGQASEVIRAVEAQNQIADEAGLREILLGQLKAGRELIRAGSFKLYIMQITLIDALHFLAKRYEREAIGGLAAALITALVKHIGIDA